MVACKIIALICSIFLFSWTRAQENDCNRQWSAYGRCMVDKWHGSPADEVTGLENWPRRSVMKNLQISKIRSCLMQQGCPDPLEGRTGHVAARAACFPQLLRKVRKDLETCVREHNPDLVLPADDFGIVNDTTSVLFYLAKDALRHISDRCPSSVQTETVVNCVHEGMHHSTPPSQPSSSNIDSNTVYCEARNHCQGSSSFTDDCEDHWRSSISPNLCKCSKSIVGKLSTDEYVQQYGQCARSVTGSDPGDLKGDAAFDWASDFLASACFGSPYFIPSTTWNQGTCEITSTVASGTTQTNGEFTEPKDGVTTVPTEAVTTMVPPLEGGGTELPPEGRGPESVPEEGPPSDSQSTEAVSNQATDTTVSPETAADTVAAAGEETRTWFFDRFTTPIQEETEAATTTIEYTTTTPAGFINNIVENFANAGNGIIDKFLNFSQTTSEFGNWFKRKKGNK